MSTKTSIQWTDATWNPVRGCSRVSEGCRNCYAEAVAARFSGQGLPYEGLARRRANGEPQWTGEVRFVESHLIDPLRWRSPKRVFVNSMSDLFHEKIPVETIDQIFAVMALAPQHTFQILTKRPERMRRYLSGEEGGRGIDVDTARMGISLSALGIVLEHHEKRRDLGAGLMCDDNGLKVWPLPNVWLGVSVENQAAANERIPLLVQTPAAARFLSCEPLLEALDLEYPEGVFGKDGPAMCCSGYMCGCQGAPIEPPLIYDIDWVIVGGESGPNARVFDPDWARRILATCRKYSVTPFIKQMGKWIAADRFEDFRIVNRWQLVDGTEWAPHVVGNHNYLRPSGAIAFSLFDGHGADMDEWPADLSVREFPAGVAP